MYLKIQRLCWLIQLILMVGIICINGQTSNTSSASSSVTLNASTNETTTDIATPTTTFIATTTDNIEATTDITTETTTTTTSTSSTSTSTSSTSTSTSTTTTSTSTSSTSTSTTSTSTSSTSTTTTSTSTSSTSTSTTSTSTSTSSTSTTTTSTSSSSTSTSTTTTSTSTSSTSTSTTSTSTSSTSTSTTSTSSSTSSTSTTTTSTTSSTSSTSTTSTSTSSTSTTSTSTSSTSTTSTTTTTTTTRPTCGVVGSNFHNVTSRTSSMFTALITYNCSLIVLPELTELNNTRNCSKPEIFPGTGNATINVTCDNIKHFAGRNFAFSLSGNESIQYIPSETFIITLQPLALNTITITEIETKDWTTTFGISNCTEIVDPKYLIFRCNSSDTLNRTLSSNCTVECPDRVPGSDYNALLVRLAVPKADKPEGNDTTFLEDTGSKTYKIALDQVTNLNFAGTLTENSTAIINFKPPLGHYDEIRVDCQAQDHHCSETNETLTNTLKNCTTCTSISIRPVVRGVKYTCQAYTIKASFNNVTSATYNFNTGLASVLYNVSNSSDTNGLVFNVMYPGDLEHTILTCTVVGNRPLPCTSLTSTNNCSSPKISLTGTLGCDYSCSFTTMKSNYDNVTSKFTTLALYPPQPIITKNYTESEKISIEWTIRDIAYIRSFDIFKNNTFVANINKFNLTDTTFYYNYTNDILPFRKYVLQVRIYSNTNISSEPYYVTTLAGAPDKPDNADVERKITSENNNKDSTTQQHVIILDTSLFSNENGDIDKYLVYVRQNLTNNVSDVNLGSYSQAQQDKSIDYLAIEIPINIRKNKAANDSRNISIILGNERPCTDEHDEKSPCNGRLQPSTTYKLIVSGCTNGGCTNVISWPFITNPFVPSSPSLIWIVALPIVVIIVIVAIIAGWKRKPLKRLIRGKKESSTRSGQAALQSSYQIQMKRPKPLYKYVNMTNEDIVAIQNEYQELSSSELQHRTSDYEPEYAVYDRYHNIPARGPWNNTAVRLVGDHRLHDYINANEIKGIYSDKQYIACQGPLQDTTEDFWEMAIQYRVSKIVMLTRTEEKNPHNPSQTLSKCFRYFPDNKGQSLRFNSVNVHVLDIENRQDVGVEIRHILIKNNQREHRVFHYYFTGWPDFSVVDREKLLDLIETIDNHENSKTSEALLTPIVVHCSAGVGRTGTYIAVDIIRGLINHSKNLLTMELDVMGIVYQLRQDRGKMVQTKDQYVLVNRSVEEILRRMNKLDEIIQQSATMINNHYESDPTDSYVNLKTTLRDSGLETSCVFKNGKKDSPPPNNAHSYHSGVSYQQS